MVQPARPKLDHGDRWLNFWTDKTQEKAHAEIACTSFCKLMIHVRSCRRNDTNKIYRCSVERNHLPSASLNHDHHASPEQRRSTRASTRTRLDDNLVLGENIIASPQPYKKNLFVFCIMLVKFFVQNVHLKNQKPFDVSLILCQVKEIMRFGLLN